MSHTYKHFTFKTKLEARWAAFFDLVGWTWATNPSPINNWAPDFYVSFTCGHSECPEFHTLLVAVLPVDSIECFKGHPCMRYSYGVENHLGEWVADGGAALGNSPDVSCWEISHGAGGGADEINLRVDNAADLWEKAGKLI